MVYPNNLKVEELILQNSKMKSELQTTNHSMGDDTASVIKVAKILQSLTLFLLIQKKCFGLKNTISWLIKLKCIFLTYFTFSAVHSYQVNQVQVRVQELHDLKNSIAQDTVCCVSGGKIKTPKSVLLPAVVKSLCNNVEVIKLTNNYGHGVSYNLIEEIETEHALMVINEQKDKKVIIPEEAFQDDGSCCIGLMVAENIDNLECTLTGSGTLTM